MLRQIEEAEKFTNIIIFSQHKPRQQGLMLMVSVLLLILPPSGHCVQLSEISVPSYQDILFPGANMNDILEEIPAS